MLTFCVSLLRLQKPRFSRPITSFPRTRVDTDADHGSPHSTPTVTRHKRRALTPSSNSHVTRAASNCTNTRTLLVVFAAIFNLSIAPFSWAEDYSPFLYQHFNDPAGRTRSYVYSFDLDLRRRGHVILYCADNRLLVALNDGAAFDPKTRSATIRFDDLPSFTVPTMSTDQGVYVLSRPVIEKIAEGLSAHDRMTFAIGKNKPVTIELHSAADSMLRIHRDCPNFRPWP